MVNNDEFEPKFYFRERYEPSSLVCTFLRHIIMHMLWRSASPIIQARTPTSRENSDKQRETKARTQEERNEQKLVDHNLNVDFVFSYYISAVLVGSKVHSIVAKNNQRHFRWQIYSRMLADAKINTPQH